MIYHSEVRRDIELDPTRGWVWLAILGGILLNLVPYPDQWFIYKPDFVALVLVIYALRLRRALTYMLMFVVGVVMDVAYTATLGQHVFSYCVLLAAATFFRQSYRVAGRLQCCVFIFITLALSLAASLSISVVYENAAFSFSGFYPAIVGALIWYLMPLLLVIAHLPFVSRSA